MQCGKPRLVSICTSQELTWSDWIIWLVPEPFSGGHEADDTDAKPREFCEVAS